MLGCFGLGSQQTNELRLLMKEQKSELERLQLENSELTTKLSELTAKPETRGLHIDAASKETDGRRIRELGTPLESHRGANEASKSEAPATGDAKQRIQARVSQFFNLHDDSYTNKLFKKYANQKTKLVVVDSMKNSLCELGVRLSPEEIASLFETFDCDENGGLDIDEFKKAIKYPCKVEQWAANLPLSQLLAHCLSFKDGDDPLREISHLNTDDLRASIEAYCDSLVQILAGALDNLKKCYTEMDRMVELEGGPDGTQSKFQTFKMSAGNIGDFHSGLLGRIGAPHPNLSKGLEDEHCAMAGRDNEFVSSNYGVRTTPRKEFEIATGRRACPPEDMLDRKGRRVRVMRRVEELAALRLTQAARLTEEEIVSVVLYTGPMFQIYNAVLRRYPEDVWEMFHGGGNLFATTIHILVSAVVKIARVMRLPAGLELFRGLGGLMELPESFHRPDANGCRGFMEWGFLSTTSNKATAIQYSGVAEGRPQAMVLRTETGAINRGACIAELSQYPGEREYLWVPCSFLEPKGAPTVELVEEAGGSAGGVVTVVSVRVSANLKARTVEELRTQKKDMHLAALRYLLAETARDVERIAGKEAAQERLERDTTREKDLALFLGVGGSLDSLLPTMTSGTRVKFTVEGLLARIKRECEAVAERHAAVPPEGYADEETYQDLAAEMLATRAAAVSMLRGYLEDSDAKIETVMRGSLPEMHRLYLSFLERTLPEEETARAAQAARLCRAMGVPQSAADEVDAEGLTRLMRAAAAGAGGRVLRGLVAARADVNRRDAKDGRTALYLAAEVGHADVVEALARLGAELDTVGYPGVFDCSPTWIAAQEGHASVIDVLGRLGADVNLADKTGRTPVHIAVECGRVAAVDALGRARADANRKSDGGRTPLALAIKKGNPAVLEALRRIGAV